MSDTVFGDSTHNGSWSPGSYANEAATTFTAPITGALHRVGLRCQSGNGTDKSIRLVAFDMDNGGGVLGYSNVITIPGANSLTNYEAEIVSPPTIPAGRNIGLGVWWQTGAGTVIYGGRMTGTLHYKASGGSVSAMASYTDGTFGLCSWAYLTPPSVNVGKVRRAGAWVSGQVKVRRGGAWVTPAHVKIRRNGAWVDVP